MHPETINKEAKRVLEKIAASGIAKNFYLAGGTALAIQLGHRKSVDLDWFSANNFSNGELKGKLSLLGKFTLTSEEPGTINGILDGVKISFFHYRYAPLYPFISFNGVNLADRRDIAAMKIDAISSRGSKKDFIDLHFLLKERALKELLGFFERKYGDIDFNKLHILKSLVFFDDAEAEPMPVMLEKVDWNDVKKKLEKEIKKIIGD